MVQHASDKRLFGRASCRSEAWQAESDILLGQMLDVGLQGAFISTNDPLPLHSVLTVRFALEEQSMRADAEVVRVTAQGMGLRFLAQSRADSKALRKYVVGAIGNIAYRDVLEQMHDNGLTTIEPIRGSERITRLLQASQDANFLVLSKDSSKRYSAKLYHMASGYVGLLCADGCELEEGVECFVLYTKDYESYSFKSRVRRVTGRVCEIDLPAALLYSERRSSQRRQLPGSVFSYAPPENMDAVEYELLESSAHGFSIKVSEKNNSLWPGVLLPNAALFEDGRKQTLANVVVQNVTRINVDAGTEWYRVGLSHGRAVAAPEERSLDLGSEAGHRGIRDRITRKVQSVVNGGMFMLHDKVLPHLLGPQEAFHVVDIPNASGKPMVGLLNTSWKQTASRVKSTVVIIPPGLCGRKENMGALAYMLTHAFEQGGRNVAVLRYDGVNNLGESFKESGCNVEGKETLKFTISDGIDDIVGAYDWVQSNPIFDPTEVIVVSVSFSCIATRYALATQRLKQVSLWVPFMGAADAANAITNVAGHVDCYRNYKHGIKNGQLEVLGSMIDGEHFCADLDELKVATLDDAKRDFGAIDADVLWIAGTHDAYMDLRRTRRAMSAPSSRRREIVEVDAGHLPRSGEEAASLFSIVCDAILKHVKVDSAGYEPPSLGWLGAVTEREWRRVRKSRGADDRGRWWASQLKSGEAVGEVLEFCEPYMDLVALQEQLVPQDAKQIVDLGCGWGTLAQKLVSRPHTSVTAIDFAEAPLARLRKAAKNNRLKTQRLSVDGNLAVGVRRWVEGELPDIGDAIGRFPKERQKQILDLAALHDSRVHTAMRGAQIDCDALGKALNMTPANVQALKDMQHLSRHVTGRLEQAEFSRYVSPMVSEALEGTGLLPFATASVDCVTCSLVVNFLRRPEDTISEAYRILKPAGRIVVSAYRDDADMSEIMLALVSHFEDKKRNWPYPATALLEAARATQSFFEQMRHLQQEGTFKKFDPESLTMLLSQAGFADVRAQTGFGSPAHAVVVSGTKA